MKHLLAYALVILAIVPLTNTAIADSDEPTLYVTKIGRDTGNCQSETSPCRTIEYALDRVGKNGRIRVGDGSYALTDVADLVYMMSGAIDVRGSNAPGMRSTLIGVPQEFATELERKGFHVIADSKSLHESAVATQLSLQSNAAATACAGGFAGSFPCSNVDLLAHVADRTPGARGSDLWGFMDLNTHREYAIVGYSSGTAVYDVTNPENPREVGFISGQSTTWRDIKVYQFWNASDNRWNAYAYITADNASDGLFVIDLSQLPQRIARASFAGDFSEAHNVYLTDTEFSTGLSVTGAAPMLILAGSNLSDGRFRGYSLANPAAPSFIAAPATPANQPSGNRLYMHDAASMIVSDSRKDTQCINAGSSDHCDVLFDFNESTIDVWDLTLPASPQRISQVPYANSGYTHSGWPSEDQQFLFVQDELDERDRGLSTTLRVFSIANLASPSLAGSWTGPTRAIDHNGFVRGNRYYMSNYSRGLSIFDISNASSPALVGRFDTYPASDGGGFPGNWGAYPFLPSGNIALSDIDSGFYLVADNTRNVIQGSFAFSAESFGGDETQAVVATVQRRGNSQGAATVNWEIVAATAGFADVATTRGTLSWPDGDASDRTISLGLNNDGVVEGLERVLIKLTAPTGGATLSSPSIASAYISDPGDSSDVAFAGSTIDVPERGFATAVAVVHRSGSAIGALSVDYTVTAGDATGSVDYSGPASGTLNWADGDATPRWIEYSIANDGSGEADEFFELTLSNSSGGAIGANATVRINILDGNGFNSAPNSIAGTSQFVNVGATVTLNGSGSNDVDGDTLTYAWSQTLGPVVALSSPASATTNFTAPTVTSDTLLRFQLLVSDAGGLTDTSTVNVTVSSGSSAVSSGGGALSLWVLFGLLGLVALSRKDVS
jgi:choice-of-anchor B domain-containing protein